MSAPARWSSCSRPTGDFHFLEMNTRLQVEHPVTEAITGLDLVEWQLRIARGEPLPLQQEQIRWQGHAIEARLCAEDAFNGFAPQAGRVLHWNVPAGEGMRIDHGLVAQPEIPPYYDSMIAKVIAYGADREQARGRLLRALAGSAVLGLRTNRDYLLQALSAPAFARRSWPRAGSARPAPPGSRACPTRAGRRWPARCCCTGAAASSARWRCGAPAASATPRCGWRWATRSSICAWPTAAASRSQVSVGETRFAVEIQSDDGHAGAVDRRWRARCSAVLAAGQRRLARCRRHPAPPSPTAARRRPSWTTRPATA